jgi:hypothetical protein
MDVLIYARSINMDYNTIQEIDEQISKIGSLTIDNIDDMSHDNVTTIYTDLIKVSNILLEKLIANQNERENEY